jgi:hypothetical protein
MRLYEPWLAPALRDTLDGTLGEGIRALRQAPDFDWFDRLGFITTHANPAARALVSAR